MQEYFSCFYKEAVIPAPSMGPRLSLKPVQNRKQVWVPATTAGMTIIVYRANQTLHSHQHRKVEDVTVFQPNDTVIMSCDFH
jgi:hypothetical protein